MRGLATTASWAGTGSGPASSASSSQGIHLGVVKRERERKIVRGPRAPAKPAFLSARRRHCHFHYVLRFIPPHSTQPQKHIRYAAASLQICRSGISSRFFHLTSAFPLCFSFVLAVFHIPYLCNILRYRTTLHYTGFSSPLIFDL